LENCHNRENINALYLFSKKIHGCRSVVENSSVRCHFCQFCSFLEKWTEFRTPLIKYVFGGKRVFHGDTGRIVTDFSVICIHFSRNELTRTDQVSNSRSRWFTFCEWCDVEKTAIFLNCRQKVNAFPRSDFLFTFRESVKHDKRQKSESSSITEKIGGCSSQSKILLTDFISVNFRYHSPKKYQLELAKSHLLFTVS
jgi:hypothetical protein